MWARLSDALAPIVAGMVLDGVDLATFGPVGLSAGVVLGGVMGWWLAPVYGVTGRMRWVVALVAAIYCATPGTEFLPVATVASALARFMRGEQQGDPGAR